MASRSLRVRHASLSKLLWGVASFAIVSCIGINAAHAQASVIDPAMLSQLSDEEKEQLLKGFQGGTATGGSVRNQDKSLSEPQVVRRRTNAADWDEPVSYEDCEQYEELEDYRRERGYQERDTSSNGARLNGENENLDPRLAAGALGSDADAYAASKSRSADSYTLDEQGRNSSGSSNFNNSRQSGNLQNRNLVALKQACERLREETADRSGRTKRSVKVKPFGYDLFNGVPNTFAPATDIPVPSDYILGPGDNLKVQLFGNQNDSFTLLVSRDGTVNFPKLGPIEVAGQRFEDFDALLQEKVAQEMIGTSVSLSLGKLRSMRVFVLGDVNYPGSYTLSSLSTITHALFVSGGVKEVGSLRNVQLKRNGRIVQRLDLYQFLLGGDSSGDMRLSPGDVVFVPPVNARITVEGEVKRPAIYELSGERTLADAILLSGGLLASTDQSVVQIERVGGPDGRNLQTVDLLKDSGSATRIQDGDTVRVRKVAKQLANEIRVLGYVKYPGAYPWSEGLNLHSLFKMAEVRTSDAMAEVYLPLGVIERTNTYTGIREFLSFNVARVLRGESAGLDLKPNDLVIVFGRDEIDYLSSRDVEAVLSGRTPVAASSCAGLQELRTIVNSQRAVRFLKTLSSESVRIEDTIRRRSDCPEIFKETPRALPYLLDKSVGIYGEVVRPGLYPVSDDTTLELLLQASGGSTSESDSRNIEYVSYTDALAKGKSKYQVLDISTPEARDRKIAAGDILNLRPVYLDQEVGTVRLMGEFRFPGTYSIVRGETLTQLIRRAGGLTDNAYTYGTVFTRESARKAEEESYKRAAKDLQEAVVTVVTSGVLGAEASGAAQFMEGAIRRLSTAEATGRVVVQADPAVLKVRPESDIVLEPKDAIFIPKRPSSVTVIGQVLSPGSLAFKSGASAGYYLDQAGGFGQAADEKRAFLVLPDGSARRLKISAWNFRHEDIPPGSSIVIPRDAAPLNALVLTQRILSIFSDLALSAAALITISNN